MNGLLNELRDIAGQAGWDEYTLLLLICQWVERMGTGDELVGHLQFLADGED